MGLRIRLRKPGKSSKQRRHNKIVVIEGSAAREGRFLEQLGYYDATVKMVSLDAARYEYWVSKGAIPTDTVKDIYKKTKKSAVTAKK